MAVTERFTVPSRLRILSFAVALASAPTARAQTPSPSPPTFTLDQAMQYALDHYPTVRAALEQVNVSTAGVSVAKAAYLPRLDSLWQSNRATANNIFGQVLPQSVIPAMSGPVLPEASNGSVWGSAVGALFSWEPLDFGLRGATVSAAEAGIARARAGEALTRLDVQAAVAATFLSVAGAQRTVNALQADLDRRDVLSRAVHTLVDNQLRPGAEASRSDAERAAAQTRLIQAREAVTLGQISLARMLGVSTGAVSIDATTLIDRVPAGELAVVAETHPLTQVHQAAVEAARAQETVLSRTDLPRLYLQSSLFARGSGANPNGQLDGGLERPWTRSRQLGGRHPDRVSECVRFHQSARPEGCGGSLDPVGDGTVGRGRLDRHEPTADGGRDGAGCACDRRKHAHPIGRRPADGVSGPSALSSRPREHCRSRGCAEPPGAGRGPGPARAHRRLARAPRAVRGAGHARAVSCGGHSLLQESADRCG